MIGPILREDLMLSPQPGALMQSHIFNASLQNPWLLNFYGHLLRSDTVHSSAWRWSGDNGKTWSPPTPWQPAEALPGEVLRRHYRNVYLCPKTDRAVLFYNEARLPQDRVAGWYTHGTLRYAVSEDGCRSFVVDEAVADHRAPHGPGHPIPGVWTGRNALMLGDHSCEALAMEDGSLLLAPSITPMGEDGRYLNPYNMLGFFEVNVLRGKWREDLRIAWETIGSVPGDSASSTRGMDEATLAHLSGGRLLMVMRGSNDRGGTAADRFALPGYRWVSFSDNDGANWSTAAPWTYDDGEAFFSPASCSQLVAHPNGRLFWIGNIAPHNPWGNLPRTPLQIGEVDRATGLLIRQSVTLIDERQPGESEASMFSNFYARVDAATGDIMLCLSRSFTRPVPGQIPTPYNWGILDYTSNAYLYRITIP